MVGYPPVGLSIHHAAATYGDPIPLRNACDLRADRISSHANGGHSLFGLPSSKRERLLQSLRFDAMYSRKFNVGRAMRNTCQWLLDSPVYRQWWDPKDTDEPSVFLWINGKAGSGKSTAMKFACERAEEENGKVIYFFFNARGGEIERSVEGMYRALLVQ